MNARAAMLYDANKKSLLVAYLLWWFLGFLGAHRLYLGRIGSGIFMLVVSIVSWVLTLVLVGFIGLALIGLWWLIDAFLIPGMVRKDNMRLIGRLTSIAA
ncbi:MAG: TM2 domain-containing protein [Phycisphaerales bacterium]|nr:TM2 domain-containing protein [Phycisphaerales bacterium]